MSSEIEELEAKLAGLRVVDKAEQAFKDAKTRHDADPSDPEAKQAYRSASEALSQARATYREAEEAAGRRTPTAQPIEAGVKAMNGGQSK